MKNIRILLAGLWVFCLILVPIVSPGSSFAFPVIQEILYDGPDTDTDDVFTEIYGVPGMSLGGWTLVGVNGNNGAIYRTVSLNGAVIPNDGILLITTSSATAELSAHSDFWGEVDWQNGPDAIQLRDTQGMIIDALQYGNAEMNNAGEGSPALDVSVGWSLSRDIFGTDTDDNLEDFMPTSSPTPGIGPSAVPEPSTLTLLTAGIVGLLAISRKTIYRGAGPSEILV